MQWRDPWSFLALGLVAALVAFLVWAARRRARDLAAFVEAALQPAVAPEVDPARRRWRAAMLVGAAALMVVALAGPMWGFRWEQVKRQGIDLVVAIDTSRSMLATDVKPNRLVRATLAVRDLVAAAGGDRLALVPFAGTAFLLCPLTLDTGAFLQSLEAVEVGVIPRGGTALPAAIDAGLNAFEGRQGNHQALVLITDGESHEGDLDAAIARARERGVRIFTVGIGTSAGELLPGEQGGFFKDRDGQVVKSRLDEATLQRTAAETGGVYLRAAGPGLGLPELYRDHIATLDARDLESTLERRHELRYRLPLGLAFLLLVLEPLIGERRRAGVPRGWWRRTRAAGAAAALAAVSLGWLDPHAGAREGNRLYEAGEYDEAARRYNEALVDQPQSPRLHFNLGDAHYKAGRWDEALAAFSKAAPGGDDGARAARVAYNMGNTRFRQGAALEAREPQKTLDLWSESLAAYRRALALAPGDVDAKFNHELVDKKLAALRKRLEQQQQEQQQHEQQQEQQQEQQEQQQEGDQQERSRQGEQPQDTQAGSPPGDEEQAPPGDADQHGPRQGEAGQDGEPGEREPDPGAAQAAAPPEPGPDAPAQPPAAGERREGELTRDEAAALLDAQRAQEVEPGEITRRLQGARVADPQEDW